MNEPRLQATDDQAVHTPAPWKEHAPNIDGEVDETYRQITAGVGFFPGDDEPGVGFKLTGFIRPADARLIAAAPELLEALRLLLKEMELSGNAGSKQYGWPVAITKSREAIAKAEGRTNV